MVWFLVTETLKTLHFNFTDTVLQRPIIRTSSVLAMQQALFWQLNCVCQSLLKVFLTKKAFCITDLKHGVRDS